VEEEEIKSSWKVWLEQAGHSFTSVRNTGDVVFCCMLEKVERRRSPQKNSVLWGKVLKGLAAGAPGERLAWTCQFDLSHRRAMASQLNREEHQEHQELQQNASDRAI